MLWILLIIVTHGRCIIEVGLLWESVESVCDSWTQMGHLLGVGDSNFGVDPG